MTSFPKSKAPRNLERTRSRSKAQARHLGHVDAEILSGALHFRLGKFYDYVGGLVIVCSTEIAILVRVAVVSVSEKPQRDAARNLLELGIFIDAFLGRVDALHTLTTCRAVSLLRLV